MKKALITGISGFVGSHLAQYLISKRINVSGIIHPKHPSNNLKLIKNKITLISSDILDKNSLSTKLKNTSFEVSLFLNVSEC